MSKAFTGEEAPDLPSLAREPPVLGPGEVRYVTPDGNAALHAELDRLRGRIAAGPEESERAALEQRAGLVAGTLAALTVLGADAAPPGIVAFARWVTVESEDGSRHRWRIVGPDEADPRQGLVSVHSPVGRALLGHGVGETVEVERPDGAASYRVVEVR